MQLTLEWNLQVNKMSPNSLPSPTQITLTPSELTSKRLTSHTLQKALSALHNDGLLVLTNAIDPSHLDSLNSRMLPDAYTLYNQQSTHRNFGHDTGNIQQEPVCEKEYIFEDVLANPFAVSIIECMVGPNPHLRFYSANTAFKASERQPVHVDVDYENMPAFPFAFCVNVTLVEATPENGATEVWLGTHSLPDNGTLDSMSHVKRLTPETLEERRKISPGFQLALPKGAMVIRDLRLWHAGRPNLTDQPRIMLVSILFAEWYRSKQKIVLPRSLQGIFDWGRLVPCVEWVNDGFDYLKGGHEHDLSLLP